MICIAAHSGAGILNESKRMKYRSLIGRAIDLGLENFRKTNSLKVAVQATIESLENDPLTNAGFGGNLTETGKQENEAGFSFSGISGRTGTGAISLVTKVPNPIKGAVKMSDFQSLGNDKYGRVPPILLAGKAADQFCRDHEFFDETWDIAPKSRKSFQKYRKMISNQSEDEDEPKAKIAKSTDTVGAVGILIDGDEIQTVSGSSSGGLLMKRNGRIGSASTNGAGFWADKASCATTSGTGEEIIIQGTARMCCKFDYTIEEVIEDFLSSTNGSKGDVGILKLSGTKDNICFEYGHSTAAMNISYGTLNLDTLKGKTEIIQSVKSTDHISSGAFKFKVKTEN